MMNPTPTLDQAYSMIIQEESQRMTGTSMSQSGIQGSGPMEGANSALVTANASYMRPMRNTNLYCDPSSSKFDNRRRFENHSHAAHNVNMNDKREMHLDNLSNTIAPTVAVFTSEQYQQILKLFSKENEPT